MISILASFFWSTLYIEVSECGSLLQCRVSCVNHLPSVNVGWTVEQMVELKIRNSAVREQYCV